MSRQIGADPQQTMGAIGAALPLILGALGRNAERPQGADALLGALQRDHAGTDLGSVLGNVFGGPRQDDGSAILGHIFGDREQRAEASLGQATGLGSDRVATLLRALAPIVMSFLAQRFAAGSNPGELGQALGVERDYVNRQGGGTLDALLDQDGDGQVDLSDLLRMGLGMLGGRR
jgi:hypothetical protein